MIPPGDPGALAAAIERLCADRMLREQHVRAARSRVEERFTAERNATLTSELYERLLARAVR